MKTNFLKTLLIIFSLTVISCFGSKDRALLQEIDETTKKFEESITDKCRYESTPDDYTYIIDYDLKFDCNNKVYQPIHLDLVAGIGLFGEAEIKNEKVKTLKMLLKEVGSCSRYDLLSAKYDKRQDIGNGNYMHHFIVKIEKGSENENAVIVDLGSASDYDDNNIIIDFLKLNPNDLIDIHIDSEDDLIRTLNVNRDKTRFGQQFCKSKVTGP